MTDLPVWLIIADAYQEGQVCWEGPAMSELHALDLWADSGDMQRYSDALLDDPENPIVFRKDGNVWAVHSNHHVVVLRKEVDDEMVRYFINELLSHSDEMVRNLAPEVGQEVLEAARRRFGIPPADPENVLEDDGFREQLAGSSPAAALPSSRSSHQFRTRSADPKIERLIYEGLWISATRNTETNQLIVVINSEGVRPGDEDADGDPYIEISLNSASIYDNDPREQA